jgi:DnaJ-class molecular chaperone
MSKEKPPDKRNPNAFEKKEQRVICPSCQGKGKIKPPPKAVREPMCPRCKGKGFLLK